MSTMTLEQVRDWNRRRAKNIRVGICTGMAAEHDRMADAIDAHLAAREADAVPVVFVSPEALRNVAEGKIGREWLWPKPNDGDIALYAAPVAQEDAAPAEQYYDTAHELFAVSQLAPGEGIEDAVGRISALLADQTRSEQVVGMAMETVGGDSVAVLNDAGKRLPNRSPLYASLPTAVGAPDLSDRYRAVMEAQGGVTDDVEDRIEQLRTWVKNESGIGNLSRSDESMFHGLLRSLEATLAAHPHTGHSAVPEAVKVGGPDQNYVEQAYNSGWNACRRAMLAAPEVSK